MLKNTLKSHGCSRTISVPPGPEQFVALRENNKKLLLEKTSTHGRRSLQGYNVWGTVRK